MPILPETAENWQSCTKRGRPPWRHMLIHLLLYSRSSQLTEVHAQLKEMYTETGSLKVISCIGLCIPTTYNFTIDQRTRITKWRLFLYSWTSS